MSPEVDRTAGGDKRIRVRRGHFFAVLGSYGLLVGLLFGVGWLVGFSIFPPRPVPSPPLARAPRPAPAPEPPPAPSEPSPPPPDPMDARVSELRARLSELTLPRVTVGAGAGHRFQFLPAAAPAASAVVADDRTWGLAVAVETASENNARGENGASDPLASDGWTPFWVPAVDPAGAAWRVRMAGEATTAEARAETNRLREAAVPAIPVRVPDLAGVSLRRWAVYWAGPLPRLPFTLRLASYKTEAGARNGMRVFGERVDGVYGVRYELEERGQWWSLYAGHFATAAAARDARTKVSGGDPWVREMPYAVLVGLADPASTPGPLSERIFAVAGFRPYLMPGPPGTARRMVGAYLTSESAVALAERLRESGVPAWGVER